MVMVMITCQGFPLARNSNTSQVSGFAAHSGLFPDHVILIIIYRREEVN